ncbi:histidine kinase [Paucibacter sp. B2R-40]|uniref:sensor histidine kinase n=1 Tax=Paucibacter sp. B2R-40 TaxID=2893554 RepID=UPI0021E3B605|nr:histidine kinase [Paucibacter sp. B2R-40]MCV2353987.1 histidine kinase [Paucibacter sp. B2R-40]
MKKAFLSVFNLRVIAAMLALSVLLALARALTWFTEEGEGAGARQWLLMVASYAGLALLPGLFILLSAACAEAALAAWRKWHAIGPRGEWLLRVGLVVSGLALAMLLRFAWTQHKVPEAAMPWGFFWTRLALYSLLGCMAYAVLIARMKDRQIQESLVLARRQSEALRTQHMEAQMVALNAQIEPHFLFNTLATTRRLYATTPDRGRDMLGSLIAYLRAALPGMREQMSSLGQELELLRNYLHILQMRMGERLSFEITAEPCLLGLRLPPLILATLVENAIKHGLAALPEGGHLQISAQTLASADRSEVVLEVRDNGVGFGASAGSGTGNIGGSGVGLANTRARLLACFGPRASLELEALQPRGVLARIRLPLPQGDGR